MLLTDILDLLKFQPKPLEYYGKYSLSTTIPILLAISLAFSFFAPINPTISTDINIALDLIFMTIVYPCATLFLKYWLGRRQKIFTFQALFNVSILTSITAFLYVLLIILGDTSNVFVYLQLVLFVYSFAVFIFAIARGAEVSFGYVLAGDLIVYVVLIILTGLLIFAFTALGVMTIPPLPSA